MFILESEVQLLNTGLLSVPAVRQASALKLTVARLLQPANAPLPKEVMPSPKVTVLKYPQPANALSVMRPPLMVTVLSDAGTEDVFPPYAAAPNMYPK